MSLEYIGDEMFGLRNMVKDMVNEHKDINDIRYLKHLYSKILTTRNRNEEDVSIILFRETMKMLFPNLKIKVWTDTSNPNWGD